MLCAAYIFATFLLFKTVRSQSATSEHAQTTHFPPTTSLLRFKRETKYSVLGNAKGPITGDEDIHKLSRFHLSRRHASLYDHVKLYDNEANPPNDEPQIGSDARLENSNTNKGKDKGIAAPYDVNHAQEIVSGHWPMGIIPYFVDEQLYDSVKRIVKAMNTIESVSCVIFRELKEKPKDHVTRWLHFTNPRQERECVHEFSTYGAETEVVLGIDCLRPAEMLHSLLHALGFRDEVAHPYRDQFIRIMWNNIQPKYSRLFRIRHDDAAFQLLEYDPMSIMHFHDRAFTDNGGATIAALVPELQLVPTTTLSQLDILRIKLAFGHECSKRSINDLIIACKKSLTTQNSKQSEIRAEYARIPNKFGSYKVAPGYGRGFRWLT